MNTASLLLVHGAWHGPWCWESVEAALSRSGVRSATVALPSVGPDPKALGGLVDDIRAVEDAAAALPGPTVVVGHSYGGIVVSGARFPDAVRRLVFLGAFMPEAGRSLVSYLPPGPLPPFVQPREDGCSQVDMAVADAAFYADCDAPTREWARSRLALHSTAAIVTPAPRASWREIPSTYIVLTQDQIIPVPAQRQMASQAADRIDLDSSHSPMLSRPAALAQLLAGLAGSPP
jgi:pimeloyl-ACP methyl ester carboxylesterase